MGIVPVHLYGLCADMKAVAAVARKHNLWVVEDNAQAIDGHGAGFKQGELSDAVCTSFIIQKNLGTFGDGGAVVTNRADIDGTVRKLRNHGSTQRSVHSFGFNSRLDDLHAAILSVKLRHITKWTDRRREIAARYTKGLEGTSFVLPYEPPGYRHAFHLYVIEHPKRDELEKFLVEAGVDVKLHYPIAIHKQAGYPWGKLADASPDVPECERNAARCVSLPMFPELTDSEIDYTIEQCRRGTRPTGRHGHRQETSQSRSRRSRKAGAAPRLRVPGEPAVRARRHRRRATPAALAKAAAELGNPLTSTDPVALSQRGAGPTSFASARRLRCGSS